MRCKSMREPRASRDWPQKELGGWSRYLRYCAYGHGTPKTRRIFAEAADAALALCHLPGIASYDDIKGACTPADRELLSSSGWTSYTVSAGVHFPHKRFQARVILPLCLSASARQDPVSTVIVVTAGAHHPSHNR
ncbi:hypothetical protein VTO42DRAFT_3198 [Malbranchea cinnamomea]